MKESNQLIRSATHLAALELSVGSFVHSLKIPFGGNFMSLVQGYFLCRYSRGGKEQKRTLVAKEILELSFVVACLKSLSPSGQKLGPMVSISLQGALYSLGLLLGGLGIFGQLLGMTLLSLWAFVQPAITFILVFGFDLHRVFQMIDPHRAAHVILIIIGIKVILSWVIVFSQEMISRKWKWEELSVGVLPKKKNESAILGAVRDMLSPLFVLSFILVIFSLYVTESSWSKVFALSLRPLGIAFLLFYFVRSPWMNQRLSRLADRFSWSRRLKERAVEISEQLRQP